MANRSYLYSIDKINTKKSSPNIITGLSEFNYGIPFAYVILLSSNPRKCTSIIWGDSDIGVVGEYEGGIKKLVKFLDLLEQEKLEDKEEYQRFYQETVQFLNKDSNKNNFILLEAGEIFDMTVGFNKGIRLLLEEINLISKELDYLFELKEKSKELHSNSSVLSKSHTELFRNLTSNWKEDLGIDYWSNILYFDFSDFK